MDLQNASGSGAAVELIDVLRDDRDLAPLPAEPLLALGDGQMGGVGLFGEHDLPAIVVKLPNAGRVPGEGLWRGNRLEDNKKKALAGSKSTRTSGRFVAKRCCIYVRISDDDEDDTCACHFLQYPPGPLKVGTPLSALTPAPVRMAIFLAPEKIFLNSDRSAET